MMPPLYAVYGASGLGRETMPLARAQAHASGLPHDRLVFIDDGTTVAPAVNGHRVLTYEEFLLEDASDRFVTIAVADSSTRAELAAKCESDHVQSWSVRAANAVVMDAVEIGDGAILSPFVTLTSNVRIGRYFHANIYSYVAHDCDIGDFVTFAPNVHCNGNVIVHDHAYLGTGAIVRNGHANKPLVIGRGAIVGMGSVVTKDVPAGITVVGNPARPVVTA
jgi:sugar O-acyltransferase (sialic acid O-acetyltransferase NeuD family)